MPNRGIDRSDSLQRRAEQSIAALAFLLTAMATACTTIATPLDDGPAAGASTDSGVYVVGITHIRVTKAGSDAFDSHVDGLKELISSAPGNVGVAYRANLLQGDRWTMSVWTDAARMGEFVASPEHLAAMRDVLPLTEVARTARFDIAVDDSPPNWDDALDALAERGVDR